MLRSPSCSEKGDWTAIAAAAAYPFLVCFSIDTYAVMNALLKEKAL